MYYVIKENGVVKSRNLKLLNKKLKSKFDIIEFNCFGNDYVVQLTTDDLSFIQDKKRMSLIPISNLYKKDNTIKFLCIGILILNFILLISK